MSKTLLIAFNGTRETGQFIGDQLCSLKMAYVWALTHSDCDKILLALSPNNEMHSWWQKFIDDFNVDVVYDTFHPGNMAQRFECWETWRRERHIEGRRFDVYRELYRRIDGGRRQPQLCGGVEAGLRHKNIFEYFYYGQEDVIEPHKSIAYFDDTMLYHPSIPQDRQVLISPLAKCQGNATFTFDYWSAVTRKLIDAGITVTINHNGHFCEELNGHPLYRRVFPDFKQLVGEVCRHKIVACGNTGIGWLAAACGTPLLAMQPINSNMPDYRYELCGVQSLVEILDQPDADYCAKRLIEEVNRVTVLTTGCYDVLHAGHVRHLEESRQMGSRLIVALNSDASVKALKGEDRPFNPEKQRAAVLQALRCVDEVRIFDGDNALDLIKSIKPDVLTNGCDHKAHEIVGRDFVESYGGRVMVTSGTRDQSSTRIIAAVVKTSDIIKAVQDASSVSPNPFAKLKLLADQLLTTNHLDGALADLGAYRGGCSLIMRRLAPHKDLHIFDTWTGNPFHDELCHHGKGSWKADIAECKALVGTDERTHYYEGVFPGTASELNGQSFSFVVIDPDTYQAVREAITFFWPRLVPGGKLFFDDYGHEPCGGVKKAVDEAFTEDQRVVYPQNCTCVVVRK